MNPELEKHQSADQSALKQHCKSPGNPRRRQNAKLLAAKAGVGGLNAEEILNSHTRALINLLGEAPSEHPKKFRTGVHP